MVSGMLTSRRLNSRNVAEWESLGSDGSKNVGAVAKRGLIGWLLFGWIGALLGGSSAGNSAMRVRVGWMGGGASVLSLSMDDYAAFAASFD